MKYLFENLEEQKSIPLSNVTWDDVKPFKDPNIKGWQKDSTDLPYDFMSSRRIDNEDEFKTWYQKFVKLWGNEGELVETRPTFWSLVGNSQWDKAYEKGSEELTKYYRDKQSGGFTGD